jgi:hypothetical protein
MGTLNKNKKGGIGIIIFFSVLFIILIFGFIASIVWSVVDIASDEITPIMKDLGMVGDTNLSQASEYTFGVADTFIQMMPWLIAIAYIMALIFTLVFIFLVGYTPHPSFIAFYFMLMVLLVFGCIIMSNMYQDIYTGSDELATRLQEQGILSYMILHSPAIMGIIALFGGVLMFARQSATEGGSMGGFGI